MRKTGILMAVAFLAGAAVQPFAAAGAEPDFTIDEINEAIKRGVESLLENQNDDGTWDECPQGHGQPNGPTGLATYALLHAGVSPRHPQVIKAFKAMNASPAEKTYGVSCYISAYAEAVRKGADEYRGPLRVMLRKMVEGMMRDGGYNYNLDGSGRWDHSNTNYGHFGIWEGQRVFGEVPQRYFIRMARHWMDSQLADGSWAYGPGDKKTRIAMTVAGTASLFVCFDNLRGDAFERCGVDRSTDELHQSIERSLDWLGDHFDVPIPGAYKAYSDDYYYLYNVERVGLAAGYKYFGTKDWFKEGTKLLLDRQQGDGGWRGGYSPNDIATAFALLFLAKGREPVMFNKLEFNGDWNNRPRDCAYLTRWASQDSEHNFGWQVINLEVSPTEWHDAPIVYISGSREPTFSEEELDKLRTYVHQGGTIFSVVECGGRAFDTAMKKYYEQLFPNYELVDCEHDHPLYTARYKLRGAPRFSIISNGVRPLVVHTTVDLARDWQLQRHKTGARAFEAAVNVYSYVTDKHYRLRSEKFWPEEASARKGEVTVARLSHDGNPDPEPLAWERFRRLMARREGCKVNVLGPLDIAELMDAGAHLAVMTGTEAFTLSEEQKGVLRQYVMAGGTLVIDAAGGSEAFRKAAQQLLDDIYGADSLRRLPASSQFYTLDGHAIESVSYRRRTTARGALTGPNLRAVLVMGRPAVIYSPEDLTTGLLGARAFRCDGYKPESAYEIMRNIVLIAGER